jgi:N-methylhydantoinase A
MPAGNLRYEHLAAQIPKTPVRARGADRAVYFGRRAGTMSTPVVSRSDVAVAAPGPLIIAEYDTNIVVPPGFSAVLDDYGHVLISKSL